MSSETNLQAKVNQIIAAFLENVQADVTPARAKVDGERARADAVHVRLTAAQTSRDATAAAALKSRAEAVQSAAQAAQTEFDAVNEEYQNARQALASAEAEQAQALAPIEPHGQIIRCLNVVIPSVDPRQRWLLALDICNLADSILNAAKDRTESVRPAEAEVARCRRLLDDAAAAVGQANDAHESMKTALAASPSETNSTGVEAAAGELTAAQQIRDAAQGALRIAEEQLQTAMILVADEVELLALADVFVEETEGPYQEVSRYELSSSSGDDSSSGSSYEPPAGCTCQSSGSFCWACYGESQARTEDERGVYSMTH